MSALVYGRAEAGHGRPAAPLNNRPVKTRPMTESTHDDS
jgi:hypothetical protein